ncbi:MAG TPA: flavodoxin [Methanocella sp.]|uniref:flavodoxin family protein n=1 Tax=Methanocella sp. TaxID=2052833 RepID=UPI002BAF84F7|nr:flavodoxin [Methanocella sp.]HTY91934.1 flavodoxin [Methanocella sp.]
MKALVIYYSRTGNTKIAGEAIARELGCDVEEIFDTVNRSGPIGWFMAGRQASGKMLTKLQPLKKDLAGYDIVIIGTPVWAYTMSTPVRTLLAENKDKIKKVAFFLTMGGRGDATTFQGMEEVCGKKPVATLALLTKNVKNGTYVEAIKKFAGSLKA